MTTTAKQAREAFGERLRNLRKDAGLTGRQLAALAGWPGSKVSKIEYGRQVPTDDDVRAWCIHTHAADQVPDLIATLRNVETAYLEWRRMRLPHRQKQSVAVADKTNLMRCFEPVLVPGLLQTPPYAEAILRRVLDFYDGPGDDLESGLAARLERQQVLYRGNHRFYFILAEQVLHTRVGTADIMAEQMDRLLTAMSLPRVVLGIIPSDHEYLAPTNNFAIYDEREVRVETISAELTITPPAEIALYDKSFRTLRDQAVHGRDARAMISEAMADLRS
ncbi:helix-turn-helix domain-containing protein [Nocardia terpenica]|uniref:Helix-turn-helix domain-containing protein n=1 Tax=Nocardia terpenica TaxID=455432 RepID=A0A6G9Z4F2_9NOCA|nr:helix-turn-helix transcriptional regulator [Nocardia terpenica]QIS20469.1 helix-turn-helix domain-containing protein [Nocardia terpenica]